MVSYKIKPKKLNESGMVSIIVTMTLIIVMSLVVIAMSRNASREQRQSLDRQLSDQAFYNAMTGINDWNKYIRDTGATGKRTDCNAPIPVGGPAKVIDGNNSVSCVLYDTSPSDLQYKLLQGGGGPTVKLTPTANIDRVRFIISSSTESFTEGNCGFNSLILMPKALSATGCNVGVLEVSLTNMTTLTRAGLISNNFVGYFLPNSGGVPANTNFSDGAGNNQGVTRYTTGCTNSGCIMDVNVSLSLGQSMMLHMKALYKDSKVTVIGYSGANVVPFGNAQLMIDATGKAEDVLRRVQVRKPLGNQLIDTDSSIRTVESLCKMLEVTKTEVRVGGVLTSSSITDVASDPKCDLN